MNITHYGHSCFAAEINGKHILFDPFITPNALAKHIDTTTIKADYILVSHGHEDHVADLVDIAKRTGAKVICAFEIHEWINAKGIVNTHPMNIGGKAKFDFGNIKCVVAIHSSVLPDGTYAGHPMGFILESNDCNFYFAGDTALTYDMKLIGDYRKINFAILPIGDNYTMGVDNAIIASEFIKCKTIIGMHYDTFDIIKINKEESIRKFSNAGKELILMDIGATRVMNF